MKSHPILHGLTLTAAALLLSGAAQAQTVIGAGNNVSYPIIISQSGSYKLSKNLEVPAGSNGVQIGSDLDVTIDLNGFSIIGGAACSRTSCPAPHTTVGIRVGNSSARIVNGTVRGFSANGIGYEAGANQSRMAIDSVNVSRNFNGIVALYLLATRVTAWDNTYRGIQASTGMIANSMSMLNGDDGIAVSVGSVQGSVAILNTSRGFALGTVAFDGNIGISNNDGNYKSPSSVPSGNVGF